MVKVNHRNITKRDKNENSETKLRMIRNSQCGFKDYLYKNSIESPNAIKQTTRQSTATMNVESFIISVKSVKLCNCFEMEIW